MAGKRGVVKWKRILRAKIDFNSLTWLNKKELKQIKEVARYYPMRINPYYLSLIKKKDDAIYKLSMPSIKELKDNLDDDPLSEEPNSPVPCIVHRYPDRVLLLVSNQCAMYCRFCTRKRKVGKQQMVITKKRVYEGIDYIKKHKEVRDVIVSGGDPLMLEDEEIDDILKRLRVIKHLEIVRIGSRVPVTLPQRVTKKLCSVLKKYHPLYVNTHFNHPDEITPESTKACNMLADAGIPLGNQTVLLKGVNDNAEVMKNLMQKLLTIRVKPYYIYHADLAKGTDHFRTKIEEGLEIIKKIRGWTSGMAVPHYVIDSPGGKIPIAPEYLKEYKKGKIVLKNYKDQEYVLFDP